MLLSINCWAPADTRRDSACAPCVIRECFNTNTARLGLAVIRAGTLDDSQMIDVVAHIWAKRKQPWLGIAEGVPTWLEAAPAADFMKALGL